MYKQGEMLYEGKAKKIFAVEGRSDLVWMSFKDDLTAFNAEKKGNFPGKGEVNCAIACEIFNYLSRFSVPSHFVEKISSTEVVAKKVEIVPLEVVVRNVLAGSTAKKLGFSEGTPMDKPLVEFFYKNDDLGDPFLSDDQALLMETVKTQEELNQLKLMALGVNEYLGKLFDSIGITLVDFKIEFGKTSEGQFLLADEISPDSCRLWDKETGEKMDKDRFRRDLGEVDTYYKEILNRLQKAVEA